MVDQWVLAGQQWLNQRYGGVSGYIDCSEDGQPGNGTFNSFIMGLQHELGISPVVPNFGPGTLAALQAFGVIDGSTPSGNLCRLINYAFFAKGFWGGVDEGDYLAADEINSASETAIETITLNMGLSESDRKLSSKVVKGLLSTDPYTLVDDGNVEIRLAQQWINGRYVNKSTFFIGPCDGYSSRNFQQALMKGVQYEIGIPEDEVNGNFGPKTIAGLQSTAFRLGLQSAGPKVSLFTTACLMNQGLFNGVQYPMEFLSSYNPEVVEFVQGFQQFSALANTTGTADYDTWAQLLVSSGNPDREANVIACDLISTITPTRGAALHSAGYRVVGRYLDESDDIPPEDRLEKEIQPGELADIFDSDLRCFPIWQYYGGELSDFFFHQGNIHGELAHDKAVEHGFEVGTCIYFAVDYDALDTEITSNILPYFRGVRLGLQRRGNRFTVGVYGSRNVCSRVSAEELAQRSFVSGMSWGFSGNLGYPLPTNWNFNQIKEFTFDSGGGDQFGLDRDVLRPGHHDRGVNHVRGPMSKTAFLSRLSDVYDAVEDNGYLDHIDPNDPEQAGAYENERDELVRKYLTYPQFRTDDPWTTAPNWMALATSQFGEMNGTVVELFDGIPVSVPRLFRATVGGISSIGSFEYGHASGWAGDLARLYAQWRFNLDDYPDGYEFCDVYLARTNNGSCLSLGNYLADASGYLVCRYKYNARGDEVLTSAWSQYAPDLCNAFFEDIWNDSTATAKNSARTQLLEISDYSQGLRKQYMLETGPSSGGFIDVLPGSLPAGQLDSFLEGFAARAFGLSVGDM